MAVASQAAGVYSVPNRLSMHCCAFGVALLAAMSAPAPASAHAILEASHPGIGDSVPAGQLDLQFRYNSRIDHQRSRLLLTRPDGSQSTLKIAQDDPPDVLSTTTDLTPGSYSVRWQVLAIDGHITRGDVRFTVTGP
jgi:methionine-rich copper-binding protein CopC